jgi:anti-anti-sigma regulatory factor
MPGNVKAKAKKASTGKSPAALSVKKNTGSRKKDLKNTSAAGKARKTGELKAKSLSLVLDPVLVINNANELHRKFSTYITKKCDVLEIDASSVEMADTAIIQLLYSLVSGLKENGTRVVWQSPSSEFSDRVRSLGMIQELGLDSVATA